LKLIINADDFGYSPGINKGILISFRRGVITSTSLMINQPFTAEAVQIMKTYSDLHAGLHINLTRGTPVGNPSEINSLIDKNGYFKKVEHFFAGSIMAAEVEKEVLAQLESFYNTGLEATHLDAHQHVHRHPTVMKAIIKGARIYNIPVRNINKETRSLLIAEKIPTPDYFISNFYNEGATLDNLRSVLSFLAEKYPRGVVELMIHPGLKDGNPQKSSYYSQRAEEFKILCSQGMKEILKEYQIELVDYLTLKS